MENETNSSHIRNKNNLKKSIFFETQIRKKKIDGILNTPKKYSIKNQSQIADGS